MLIYQSLSNPRDRNYINLANYNFQGYSVFHIFNKYTYNFISYTYHLQVTHLLRKMFSHRHKDSSQNKIASIIYFRSRTHSRNFTKTFQLVHRSPHLVLNP